MDIQTAKEIIEASVLADDSVLMKGPHGIGKSNIVKQFAKENGYHLEELFLSHQEVGDVIGIPHIVEKEGVQVTTWSKPIWLQRMDEAALPSEVEFDDLIFNDKSFEEYIKKELNI